MTKLLYDVPEALRLLSLGRTKFYAEVRAGRIVVVKAGGKALVPASSLEQYVASKIDEAKLHAQGVAA